MKTLENHTLIYDAECPLCNAYTQGFIKYKMLDINGRTAFQQFDFDNNTEIDKTKAANKIVLFNSETNEITYGLPSLIKIIGLSFRSAFISFVCSAKFLPKQYIVFTSLVSPFLKYILLLISLS